MKIYLASDHAGFSHKEAIAHMLVVAGHEIIDCGAVSYDAADDYPAFMHKAALAVSKDSASRAVLFGGSGQGEAIVANRRTGVRAVVYYGGSLDIIKLSREHNDANVLSLGARFLSIDDAKAAVSLWLGTPFSADERHVRRIGDIDSKHI
ncbi:MAG: RpiB/LacA/LacB family sugar-phosphate isomerase [Patescibacteria group bacterium]